MWRVEFNPESLLEMEAAVAFYKEKSITAAEAFRREIEEGVAALETNPFFQNHYKTIRCLPLKKFPYMIHFELDEVQTNVKIAGCIHTSLNPDKSWR